MGLSLESQVIFNHIADVEDTLQYHLYSSLLSFFFFFFLSFVFCLCLIAYGGFQARGLIRAIAAGLRHSHSNTRSELCLRPTPELMETPDLNPLSEARNRTQNLMVPSQICF